MLQKQLRNMNANELLKELKRGQSIVKEALKDADSQLKENMTDEQWDDYKRFKKRHAKAMESGNTFQAMNIVKEFKKKWQ